ncbi:hypothetical protein [Motiliproteus sp. MSK22-1]|uniref:hypothetical protein n=1 Tax=Motiliproteus sp. MSK22-1 TaxID=1897630 RepID=UPI000975A861|nr:hypothetical protein [Motiliproteus sp. MSK22-1]OMH29061.1 hypothetical protein BGP75_20100 [Motiliproteus sp. MSK22-1]
MGIQNYDSIDIQENRPAIALPQVALALTELKLLEKLVVLGPEPGLDESLKLLNWESAPIEPLSAELCVKRVYLGNEFCERLLPTPVQMAEAIACTKNLGIDFSLQTPLLTDSGIKRLRLLLGMLPEGTEVIVNDWGTLRLLTTDYRGLKPLLGRLLYKMIKDPRLPSAQWTRLHPHSGRSKPFQHLLDRFGVDQIEMDVPPFTQSDQFDVGDMDLSVYLPYGYVVKGRMCRIGSLGQEDASKFVAGHACKKECLDYVTLLERDHQRSSDSNSLEQKESRQKTAEALLGFQRGNTQFYRYSQPMELKILEAIQQGRIKRLVFAGDWNENCRTH